MGALACMELVSRRLQQYTVAHAHGADASNWARAKHFSGSSSSLDLVPLEVRSYTGRLSGERGARTHTSEMKDTQLARALVWGPLLPQSWSEVFLVTRVKEMVRKAGEAGRPHRPTP